MQDGVVLARGFFGQNVEAGAADPALVEGADEGGFVDSVAAADAFFGEVGLRAAGDDLGGGHGGFRGAVETGALRLGKGF